MDCPQKPKHLKVSSIDYRQGLRRALISELIFALHLFHHPEQVIDMDERNRSFMNFWFIHNCSFDHIIHTILRLCEAVDTSWPRALERAKQDDRELRETYGVIGRFKYFYSMGTLPSVCHFVPFFGRLEVRRQSTGLAIACELFRRRHGHLPDSLNRLAPEFISEVPRDIFCPLGEPLKYRISDDEYVVYSVGDNGTDDGASPTEYPNDPRASEPDITCRVRIKPNR